MDVTPKARATATRSQAVASPQYASFPKPQIQEQSPWEKQIADTQIRQQQELTDAEDAKKPKEEDDGIKQYTSFTGPRFMEGGDTGALAVLASMYDSPVIRMFIAANQRRKI